MLNPSWHDFTGSTRARIVTLRLSWGNCYVREASLPRGALTKYGLNAVRWCHVLFEVGEEQQIHKYFDEMVRRARQRPNKTAPCGMNTLYMAKEVKDDRKRKHADSPPRPAHDIISGSPKSKGGGTDRTWDHPKGKGKSKTKGHKGKEAQQRGWNGYPRQWPREPWRDEDRRADE